MRCIKPTLLFLTVLLCLTIQISYATRWYFPKSFIIPDGLKVHFGNYWIQTTGSSMTINTYFLDDWFNYSCSGGTQQIFNGSRPTNVYFNEVEQVEGDNWSYANGIVTLTPSGTNVSILWSAYVGVGSFAYAETSLVDGSQFQLEFWEDSSLAFQHDNKNFTIEVIDNFLNGTNGRLILTSRYGSLRFTASNNSRIELSSDNEDGFRLKVEGFSVEETDTFTYQGNITSGIVHSIFWSWNRPSFVDTWFMFGVGMMGIAMMIFGPFYLGLGIINKAYSYDTVKRIGWAMLLFIIGLGLVICWLWPGGG